MAISGAALTADDLATLLSSGSVTVSDLVFTSIPTALTATTTASTVTGTWDKDKYNGTIEFNGTTYTVTLDSGSCLHLVDSDLREYVVNGKKAPTSGTAVDTEYTLASSTNKYGNFILKQTDGTICLNQQNTVDGVTAIKMGGNSRKYQIWNDNANFTIKAIKFRGTPNGSGSGEPTFAVTSNNSDATITSPTYTSLSKEQVNGAYQTGDVTFLIDNGKPEDVITFDMFYGQAYMIFTIYYEFTQEVTLHEGYASYAPVAEVKIPDGITAYVAKDSANNVLTLEPVESDYLVENVGVILRSNNTDDTSLATFTTVNKNTVGNIEQTSLLTGSTSSGFTVGDDPVYVLGEVDSVIGMYKSLVLPFPHTRHTCFLPS